MFVGEGAHRCERGVQTVCKGVHRVREGCVRVREGCRRLCVGCAKGAGCVRKVRGLFRVFGGRVHTCTHVAGGSTSESGRTERGGAVPARTSQLNATPALLTANRGSREKFAAQKLLP